MAINLITGLPGNAKTLFTIATVKEQAEREGRPVFYAGIPELTLDWTEVDPVKWMEVPPKSIVVIDECQKIFRNRSLGATPPPHVTELETHRHLGIDLYFITQHPSLIDPQIRRLAASHRHMVRIWGMEKSTVHKWDSVRDNCDKDASRRDSQKTVWKFDKSIYKLYKSAEEHTVTRSIPTRVKMLLLLPVVLTGAAWFVWWQLLGKHKHDAPPAAAPVAGVTALADEKGIDGRPGRGRVEQVKFDPVEDARHYVQMNTPRVSGLAFTAPKYDQITVPTRAPVPAACIKVADRCRCYSQQGTSLDVEYNMCLGFATTGYFQDFDPEKDRADSRRTADSVRVLEGRGGQQLAMADTRAHGGGQVVTFGDVAAESPHVPPVGK